MLHRLPLLRVSMLLVQNLPQWGVGPATNKMKNGSKITTRRKSEDLLSDLDQLAYLGVVEAHEAAGALLRSWKGRKEKGRKEERKMKKEKRKKEKGKKKKRK